MTSFLAPSGPVDLVWTLYVVLGSLVLFVAGIRLVSGMARRHRDEDGNGGRKLLAAAVVGVVLAGTGFVAVAQFQESSLHGIHTTFVAALNKTVGEADYLDLAKSTTKKSGETLPKLEGDLARAEAAFAANGNESNRALRDTKQQAVNQTRSDLAKDLATLAKLTPNHLIWLKVEPLLHSGREAEARTILMDATDAATITNQLTPQEACKRDAAGACASPLSPAPIAHSYIDLHGHTVTVDEGIPMAYEHLEEFPHQMDGELRYFVYPGLTGLLLAPLVFAGGSILRRAFVPSDTVGYKQYPAKAAGLFLLLGAFGLFAIPFAAWTLRDMATRSREGQIAL